MAKRKKYPKLPNGYGQIRYLGKNRRNPYGVYPPATEEYPTGQMKPAKAICYAPDWLTAFRVLTSYKAGTYKPGDEKNLEAKETKDANEFVQQLLADYNQMQGIEQRRENMPSFSEIFKEYYLDKFKAEFGHKGKKKSMEYSMCAAYKNCAELHDKEFISLTKSDLQAVIDNCTLKHASLELILTLYHQMYNYAVANDICDKDYSLYVSIGRKDDDEHGIPFTDADLKLLWQHQNDETVEMILIMCYSGFRISAYKDLHIDLRQKYFKGGIKTEAGKDRTVPIHSGIYGLVKRRIRRDGSIMKNSTNQFRESMYKALNAIGIKRHTPHDCRHTFSKLCEDYGVNENDRKRMLGHAFQDITNRIYGHRELEDLRTEIEKIKLP